MSDEGGVWGLRYRVSGIRSVLATDQINLNPKSQIGNWNSEFGNRKSEIGNRTFPYIVFTSKLRHKYQHATDRYGSQHFAIFSICAGLGILRLR